MQASRTAAFSRAAPCDPPTTRISCRLSATPSEARARYLALIFKSGLADACCRAAMGSRTGSPVTTGLGRSVPSKATAEHTAQRAASRLADPGLALASKMTTGMPRSRAARAQAALTYPPCASTILAVTRPSNRQHCQVPTANAHAARRSLAPIRRLNPRAAIAVAPNPAEATISASKARRLMTK